MSSSNLDVYNPATGEVIASIPNIDAKHIPYCITNAQRAFQIWSKMPADERAMVLAKSAQMMRDRKNDLAHLLSLEQGKTLKEAQGEIDYGLNFFDWYSEEARRIKGFIHEVKPGKEIVVRKEPIGVCAAITPWNFPSAMITRKAGAALAAGCTMLVKPAPDTPLSAFAIQEILLACGAPEGALQIVSGDAQSIGEALLTDKRIRKFSFTGSTRTGKYLMEKAAQTLKKLTLELGGNSPFIVFDDADLERAVSDGIFSKFRNGGQACTSINRYFLQKGIKEKFLKAFIPKVKEFKAGNGLDPASDIGALINKQAVEKIITLVKDAVSNGASMTVGAIPDGKSLVVSPIVLENVPKTAKIFSEEVFGPVVAIYDFTSEEEVIEAANNTDYGLASYVYTTDLARANRMVSALEYGMVGLNDSRLQLSSFPFGGIKHSGFGREGSSEGVEEYLVLKSVNVSY